MSTLRADLAVFFFWKMYYSELTMMQQEFLLFLYFEVVLELLPALVVVLVQLAARLLSPLRGRETKSDVYTVNKHRGI
jgi:hypothetical protein